ncbi:hypothetical protein PE074_06475 [Wohlfahrtiimonas chitiniclastica]|uniref:hypothetical protein n=1 Tax=Wohlfahrtiimonas chitiniclastica TaxID=400946 RepID=UPI0007B3FC60|nr:hypothetical protein [Wohlfahrtiimonas chitiniclastica]KZS22221.1 hypothetical protein BMY_0037 [Wohlfahrtiimonas chitiniclastica]WHR54740.1 hypothetical protein PE074_06475 [Wohlfahrtiimonas chitiniclastica]
MKEKYSEIDEDRRSNIFKTGLTCSSLLFSVRPDIEKNDPLSYTLFEGEFLRFRDFLEATYKLGILFDHDENHYMRNNDIRLSLFRSVIEGHLRMMYVFRNGKYNQDSEERFELIVSSFRDEYRKYRSDLLDIGFTSLPELIGECEKNLGAKRIIDILKADSNDEEYKSGLDGLYCMYRYCCFFSHGNMSDAILKSAQCKTFGHFDLYMALERMAMNYMGLFCNLTDNACLLLEAHNVKIISKFYNKDGHN